MKAPVFDKSHKETGTAEISDEVFAYDWKPALVHQVVVSHLANRRFGAAHAKDRSEVSGGGRKPWRQKGTGRARHGSIRSPIWVGGGATFGPRNERDFSKKVNKKMKKGAFRSALSKKLADGELFIVDALAWDSGKTKDAHAFLKGFFSEIPSSVLVVPAEADGKKFLSMRNVPGVTVLRPEFLSTYDVAAHKVVIMEVEAAKKIQ